MKYKVVEHIPRLDGLRSFIEIKQDVPYGKYIARMKMAGRCYAEVLEDANKIVNAMNISETMTNKSGE